MTTPHPTHATARMDLIRGNGATLSAAAARDHALLGRLLDATVPEGWPPQFLDDPAMAWTRDKLAATGDPWWAMWFGVLRPAEGRGRLLVASMGFKGPPRADGSVEIGYGIIASHHRRGLASEGAAGLVEWALRQPGVRRITAHTLTDGVASMGVLKKCGFRFVGPGEEESAVLWEWLPG